MIWFLLVLFGFWNRISCCLSWEDDFELRASLPLPFKCWNSRLAHHTQLRSVLNRIGHFFPLDSCRWLQRRSVCCVCVYNGIICRSFLDLCICVVSFKICIFQSFLRFLFLLLGPAGKAPQYHEIGRSIATLMTDEVITVKSLWARQWICNYSPSFSHSKAYKMIFDVYAILFHMYSSNTCICWGF